MKELPHLLVITPTLGESEFLTQTLDSVAALRVRVTHILSCPKAKIAELQSRFPETIVLEDAGRAGGIYGALNAALAAASEGWEWFTYINDDDLLGQSFGEILLAHSRRANAESVFYGNVRLIDIRGGSLGFITTAPLPKLIPAILQQQMSPLNQQGMVFSRECVQFLHRFDLKYKLCADLDFWARAYANDFRFRFYPVEVGQFRIRAGQLSGNVEMTRSELAEITQKHFPVAVSRFKKMLFLVAYRIYNLPRYMARFQKVGLKTSESVLAS